MSLVVSVSLPSLSQTSSQDLNRESEQPQSGTHRAYVCGFKVLSKSGANLAGDYGGRVLESVRSKWYPPILELRESTALQRGTTFVAFEIRGDGSLAKVKVAQSSGTRTLDGIAKQAIVSSAPFARSPGVSGRKELKLQMYFGYNQPVSAEARLCDGPNWGAHPPESQTLYTSGKGGVKPPHASYSPDPEYSEEARQEKYGIEVTIAGTVDAQGAFTDFCIATPPE